MHTLLYLNLFGNIFSPREGDLRPAEGTPANFRQVGLPRVPSPGLSLRVLSPGRSPAAGPALQEPLHWGMQFGFSTPALLFPAISLLFISYTNRFISYAELVRRLHDRWAEDGSCLIQQQIENLRLRIKLIRNMQVAGAVSLLLSVVSMVLIVAGLIAAAEVVFVLALVLMVVSMGLLVYEVSISVRALNLQLRDMSGSCE